MPFKIDFDKIVDGLTKEFTPILPASTGKVLSNALDQLQNQTKTQEECDNLSKLKDSLDIKKTKTKAKSKPKIKKAGVKKIIKDAKPEPKDDEVVARFQEKELSILKGKVKISPKKEQRKRSTEILSIGRRLVAVDETVFNPDYNLYLKVDPISTNQTFISDNLRGRSGKYWSLNKESKNFGFVGNEQAYKTRAPFIFDFHEIVNDDEPSDFGRTFQVVGLESRKDKFVTAKLQYSKDLWKSFVKGKKYLGSTKNDEKLDFTFDSTIPEDIIFLDHSFELNLPFEQKQMDELNLAGALSAKVEPIYNFFIEDYETNIAKKDVLENTLPNMYIMLSEMNSEFPNPEFKRLISLDGTIQTDSKRLMTFKKKQKQLNKSRVYDLKTNPMGEYFDMFGRQYQNAVKSGVLNKLNNKFSNIGISIDDIDVIRKFTDKEELFPLSVHITFETDKTTTFAQILKDTSLSDAFTSKIINRIVTNNFDLISTQEAVEEVVQQDGQTSTKKTNFLRGSHKTWDLADLIDDLQEGQEPLVGNAVYLGDYAGQQRSENRPEFKFFRSLNSEIFQSKVQTLIRDKMRSYEDLLEGTLAYSETVLYRIAKFIGNDAGNEPIQNIWIPNATDLDVLDYVDTQVKYDKRYTYVIYAYQMVIGNRYWYADVKTDEYDHHASFRVYQEPSLRLVEIPYYKFVARIVDKPPAPPDTNFVAYKGVDNKFLITFNNSVTEFKTQPILIKSSDQDNINKVREAQRLKPREPIAFGGDDRIAQYEVYRLTEKPTSYLDFANALIKIVNTDVSKETQQKATSASFVDSVQSNKKYWYVFRAIDVHGHISNPTFLYETEIINEHGTIFPLVNVVDFREPFEKDSSKSLKRFIQIIPTVLQGLIDEDKSGFLNAKSAEQVKNKISLGLADQKVWGKTFRIRLISRNTGKKIDFDVNFLHRSVIRVKAE